MVKKSGFLNKIVGRFRAGSVRVEEERTSGRQAANQASARPNGSRNRTSQLPASPVPEEIIPGSRRKLSDKEAAQLTMTKSFQELSTLLKGVQNRMEDQGGKVDSMSANVARLPAAAEAQVEMLKALVSQIEKQNTMNGKMVETFAELPDVMKGVQESLKRSASTDERTASTLDDFKSTMDRIQGSIGDMVDSAQSQADATATLAEGHQETVQTLKNTTQDGIEALRRAQEDQANRMAKIASENGRSNRVVVVLLILSFAAMVAILVALLNGSR